MIPIACPDIGEGEKKAVAEVLDSGVIAQGPKVGEFEQRFAEYVGVEYAVAVSSGTAALHVALLAHGLGVGDEIITSPFTFIASSNAVLFTGAKPVFADIEEDTFNLDPEKVKEKITPNTKAILPIHLFGHPADMGAYVDLAADHGLALIEDACQAHGATYKGEKVGSFGSGCFSFYPTKNMTTGEGGMITTDDKIIDRRSRSIRQHGMSKPYTHEVLGHNFRTTDIAAAIGLEQLTKLNGYNKARRDNAKYLMDNISSDLVLPVQRRDCFHVFHQFTVRVRGRDEAVEKLRSEGVGCGIYYPTPSHRQPLYVGLGYGGESYPVAQKAAGEVLSLPVHPKLKNEDLDKIVKACNRL